MLHFENGAVESWNPDLGIEEQAELLPYDKRWEFPRDKLKLGKLFNETVLYFSVFLYVMKKYTIFCIHLAIINKINCKFVFDL